MKVAQIKNHKMNDLVYKKRRQVMNLIYEVKKEFLSFPRIEVRIGEARDHNVLGVAKLSKKQIWITDQTIQFLGFLAFNQVADLSQPQTEKTWQSHVDSGTMALHPYKETCHAAPAFTLPVVDRDPLAPVGTRR